MNEPTSTSRLHAIVIQNMFQNALKTRRETIHANDSEYYRYSHFVISEFVLNVINVVFEDSDIGDCDELVVSIEVDYSNEHDGIQVDIQYLDRRANVTAKEVADALAICLGVKVTCDVSEKADTFVSG